jgi:U3 small nucleolar RNA-associated protein 15
MPAFPGVKVKQYANVQERETSEAKYWKSYVTTSEDKLPSSPNCIDFCPLQPEYYIVTGSTKVHLYSSATDKVQRAFSRFTDDAYCGRFRKDGKLIAAGDKSGYLKVFDTTTKAVLRQMKRHTGAVRAVAWSADGLNIISGSDDKTVKRWDLSTGEAVWDSRRATEGGGNHADYVRCVSSNPVSNDIFVSGCYDHTVKIWDSRQASPAHTLRLGAPVETCMIASSGAVLLTAAGNELQMWDLLSGCRPMHTFSSHQKNITSLAMDASGSRVLSAGLDGHVKVYSLQTLQVVHGMKFGSPISSIGLSPDSKKLLVGFVDGSLFARTKKSDALSAPGTVVAGSASASAAAHTRFYKGAGLAAEQTEDGMVETERTVRLRPYEVQFKKFNYQGALDSALKTRNPLIIVTVLEELSRRSGLAIALSGRDESSLEPLLSFCARYVSNPRYARLVVQVVHGILDIYAGELGHSDSIDELFLKMRKSVKVETQFQREVLHVCGALDCIVSASSMLAAKAATNTAISMTVPLMNDVDA